MKKNAIPSLYLPLQTSLGKSAQHRINRQKELNIHLHDSQSCSSSLCLNDDDNAVTDLGLDINNESKQVLGNLFNNLVTSNKHVDRCKCDKSIQVQNGDFVVSFIKYFRP